MSLCCGIPLRTRGTRCGSLIWTYIQYGVHQSWRLHRIISPNDSSANINKMADFNSLLSNHLSNAFSTLQSRYTSTPQPRTLPLNQSPTFSTPHKFHPGTQQWSPLAPPSAHASHIDAETTVCIFSWDAGPLCASGDAGLLAKAMETLKSRLLPATLTVLLLRNVPARLLPGILAHPFVRRAFVASDVDALSWPGLGPGKPAESGTVVLVDCASESLVQAVFRVRTAFGEEGEGGEDVCFVDIRMRGGTVGRVGVLAGERGSGVAGEWKRADGVEWGVLAAAEGSDVGGNGRGGVFWSGACEIVDGDGDGAAGEYGLLRTRFKIAV